MISQPYSTIQNQKATVLLLLLFVPLLLIAETFAHAPSDSLAFDEYRGVVLDKKSGIALPFASLMVAGANTSTVTNADGQFSFKIKKTSSISTIRISYLGYKTKELSLASLQQLKMRVELEPTSVQLPEINVVVKDAKELIRAMLDHKAENSPVHQECLTAFYREAIKKGRTYVSLSEAVVEVYKQPYASMKDDMVKLYKSRKSADYTKLDTLSFKLMGGPFNTLYLDVLKYPDMLFSEDMNSLYSFTFDRSTYMDNRLMFIVDFKQHSNIKESLYYGKLYIDAQTYALKTAIFNLNVENRSQAAELFIKRKPLGATVYPTLATYRIDYMENRGKWYYGYGRIELGMKINWKKKLFNTHYNSVIEMAVTDRAALPDKATIALKDRIHPSVVISNEASGFSDPLFWGAYNVIEPEKPIESAIKKIQRQLEKK